MTVVRRLPFTLLCAAAVLVVGAVSGALWSPAASAPWYPHVAHGVPSLLEGRWWTPLTGAFLAGTPWAYVPVIATFVVAVGAAEWRLGTRFTALFVLFAQAGAVLVAVSVLMLLHDTGRRWVVASAASLEVGFSAGALAALALLPAFAQPPWRLRLRLVLGLYAAVAFLFVGSLSDLVHLPAVAGGLLAGARLGPRLGAPSPARPSRRELAVLVTGSATLVVVCGYLLGRLLPVDGPLGHTASPTTLWLGSAVALVVAALPVSGLRLR